MYKVLIIFLCLFFTSCSSLEADRQANKNIALSVNLKFGIDGLPIPIPSLNLGFDFNIKRLTPQEEIELELAKQGKFRKEGEVPKIFIQDVPVSPNPSPSKLEK